MPAALRCRPVLHRSPAGHIDGFYDHCTVKRRKRLCLLLKGDVHNHSCKSAAVTVSAPAAIVDTRYFDEFRGLIGALHRIIVWRRLTFQPIQGQEPLELGAGVLAVIRLDHPRTFRRVAP